MNIFAIEGEGNNIDWIASARSQDNYRVVKMILESCQILSTVLNEQGVEAPYRSFNPKHPSCLWAAESSDNFEKLVLHCDAMLKEYTRRFGRVHKCRGVLTQITELYNAHRFPQSEPTRLRMAMPDYFRGDSIVESYRKFYASKPRIRYPEGCVPVWFDEYRGDKPYEVISE